MKKIRVKSVSRSSDDRLLQWLEWYDQGISFAEIARRSGLKSYQSVQQAIKAVHAEMDPEDQPAQEGK